MATGAVPRARIDYPDSDGAPMADNTLQFRWIVTVKGNLDAGLPDFVAGDLLWYPFEGDNVTRVAPDVLVALGRPKGERGSYRQWEEGGVAPQWRSGSCTIGSGSRSTTSSIPRSRSSRRTIDRGSTWRGCRTGGTSSARGSGCGSCAAARADAESARADAEAARADAEAARAARLAERLRALGIEPEEDP